jgi:hypothetical protein
VIFFGGNICAKYKISFVLFDDIGLCCWSLGYHQTEQSIQRGLGHWKIAPIKLKSLAAAGLRL